MTAHLRNQVFEHTTIALITNGIDIGEIIRNYCDLYFLGGNVKSQLRSYEADLKAGKFEVYK